jgi:hypothetical protein
LAAAVKSAQEDSFDKELEFYELLELDADGEDDIDHYYRDGASSWV